MAIVHIHIERTGGVSLQDLYERKFPGQEMIWHSVRDGLFAPFNIKTANYTKAWQLKLYAGVSTKLPKIRKLMLFIRRIRRQRASLSADDLADRSVLVIGHFSYEKLLAYLPPDKHTYRTIIRDPLERMWSHYSYWYMHKGDVGHRVVPKYSQDVSFEDFALLPELENYQTQAIGENLSIYEHIGLTNQLQDFALTTDLLQINESMPKSNSFSKKNAKFNRKFY